MSTPRGYMFGVACAVLSGLCFSTAGLLMRRIDLDAWEIVFWRCLFAALAIGLFLILHYRSRLVAVLRGVGLSGVLAAAAMAYTLTAYCLALDVTLVANVLACLGITPFLTAILGWALMRERIALATWFGMVLALGGIVLIVAQSIGGGPLLGNLLALSLAAVFAVYIVLMRRARLFDMMPAALFAALIAGVIALPLGLPFEIDGRDLPYLIAFGAGQLGGGLIFFTFGSRHLPAAPLSLIMLIEPVGGVLWAWLGAGEAPAGLTLAGAGLVLLAVLSNALYGVWRRPGWAVAG